MALDTPEGDIFSQMIAALLGTGVGGEGGGPPEAPAAPPSGAVQGTTTLMPNPGAQGLGLDVAEMVGPKIASELATQIASQIGGTTANAIPVIGPVVSGAAQLGVRAARGKPITAGKAAQAAAPAIGAGVGAGVGSIVPGIGTAIGAIVGGLVGTLTSAGLAAGQVGEIPTAITTNPFPGFMGDAPFNLGG